MDEPPRRLPCVRSPPLPRRALHWAPGPTPRLSLGQPPCQLDLLLFPPRPPNPGAQSRVPRPASRVPAPGISQPPRCSGPTSLTFLQSPSQQSQTPRGKRGYGTWEKGVGSWGPLHPNLTPPFTVSLGKGVASPWELPPASAGLGGEGPGGEQNCPRV